MDRAEAWRGAKCFVGHDESTTRLSICIYLAYLRYIHTLLVFVHCAKITDGREKGGNRERKKERGEEGEMVSWSRLVERLHHSPIPTSFIYVHC